MERIEQALRQGEWTEEALNQRVRRILQAKKTYRKPGNLLDRPWETGPQTVGSQIAQCYRKSVVLWKQDSLPVSIVPDAPRLYLALGGDQPRKAYDRFGLFAQADFVSWPWPKKDRISPEFSGPAMDSLLGKYKESVIAWHIPSHHRLPIERKAEA